MSEAVTLTVDGVGHVGWTAARVSRSIDTCAMQFTVEVTEWSVPESARRRIRPGARCELRLGGTLAAAGWIALMWGDRIIGTYLHMSGFGSRM